MRHQPFFISRVAAEPATYMIIDSASVHPVQGFDRYFDSQFLIIQHPITQQEGKQMRCRELGGPAKASVFLIKVASQDAVGPAHVLPGNGVTGLDYLGAGDMLQHRLTLAEQFLALGFPCPADSI